MGESTPPPGHYPRLAAREQATPSALPRVVVLNGPSSSGKTMLARTLAEELPGRWDVRAADLVAVDLFRRPADLPDVWRRFRDARSNDRELVREWGNAVLVLAEAAVAAAAGRQVVVDMVVWGKPLAAHLCRSLDPDTSLLIGVYTNPDVLRERERHRRFRRGGTAFEQLAKVHRELVYDLVVDTTRGAPSGLAGEIMAIAPTAMRTMLHAARRPFKDASE